MSDSKISPEPMLGSEGQPTGGRGPEAGAWPGDRLSWTMFLVSALVLFIEIVYFQVLIFVHNYLKASSIIAYALLGLALGGLVGYVVTRKAWPNRYLYLAIALVLAQVLPLVNIIWFPRLLSYPIMLSLPFFVASIMISNLFAQASSFVIYFYNLAGSAVGVLLAAASMTWLGEEASIVMGMVVAALMAVVVPASSVRARKLVGSAMVVLSLGAVVWFAAARPINFAEDIRCTMDAPELRDKVYCKIARIEGAKVIISESSLVARVDIAKYPRLAALQTFQAGTLSDHVQRFEPKDFKWDIRLPRGLVKDPRVLVVGTSAEGVVKTARILGKGKVSGVEINPAIVRLMEPGGKLYEASARAYDDVDVHVVDARTYLRGTDEKFDIMTFMNTHSRGRIRENVGQPEYLYTVQAFEDVLRHLTDRGFAIYEEVRTYKGYDPVIFRIFETLSVAMANVTGDGSLKDKLYAHTYTVGATKYMIFMVKRTHFTDENKKFLRWWLKKKKKISAIRAKKQGKRGVHDIKVVLFPGKKLNNKFSRFVFTGQHKGDMLMTPITDDSPFLFDLVPGHPVVRSLFWTVVALTVVLILLPVLVLLFKNYASRSGTVLSHVGYFSLIGLGYMLSEVVLMQKYQLFLGSPVYSFIVVLGSMLLFSGVGGLVGARLSKKLILAGIFAVPVLLLVYMLTLPGIFGLFQASGLATKIVVALLTLFPLFFVMGLPFPYGLELVKGDFGDEYTALLFGVNGAASTVGSVLSMYVSVAAGFSMSMWTGVACYLAAFLLVFVVSRRLSAMA